MKSNLKFFPNSPVNEISDLYGREREVSDILNYIQSYANLEIRGERRIGKTSLLLSIKNLLLIDDNFKTFIPIFIDLTSLPSNTMATDFYEFIIEELVDQSDIFDFQFSYDINKSTYREFVRLIKLLEKNCFTIILMLDEFDHILNLNELDNSFFTQLRGIVNNYKSIKVLTSNRNPLETLCHRGSVAGSHFWNIFNSMSLGLVENKEPLFKMLSNLISNVSIIEFLLSTVGSHPAYLRLAANELFASFSTNDFDEGLAYIKVQNVLEKYFQKNIELLSEDENGIVIEGKIPTKSEFVKALFHIASDKNIPQFSKLTLERLHRMGYLKFVGNKYEIYSPLFKQYLVESYLYNENNKESDNNNEINAEFRKTAIELVDFIQDKELKFKAKEMILNIKNNPGASAFEYTGMVYMLDHGKDHLNSVYLMGYRLLQTYPETLKRLSDSELYTLICGIWLHDIGMGVSTEQNKNERRKRHGQFSAEELDKFPYRYFVKEEFKKAIGKLCTYHQSKAPLDEQHVLLMEKNNVEPLNLEVLSEFFPVIYKSISHKLRIRFLAAILSFLDCLDVGEQRLDVSHVQLIKENFSKRQLPPEEQKTNLIHYNKHRAIDNIYIFDKEIILQRSDLPEAHEFSQLAIKEIQNEWERCRQIMNKNGIEIESIRFWDSNKDKDRYDEIVNFNNNG